MATLVVTKRVEEPSSAESSVPSLVLMSAIMTSQSLEMRCLVKARPMPEAAPVIMATGFDMVFRSSQRLSR